jgi:hypothetical protein
MDILDVISYNRSERMSNKAKVTKSKVNASKEDRIIERRDEQKKERVN